MYIFLHDYIKRVSYEVLIPNLLKYDFYISYHAYDIKITIILLIYVLSLERLVALQVLTNLLPFHIRKNARVLHNSQIIEVVIMLVFEYI